MKLEPSEQSGTYNVSAKSYRIKIADHILDNVYGQIGITEVEQKLERLPIFKRLHNISQLGLTNWIFPCALHTRYVHSIGVMHTAYNMALHINKNHNDFFDDNYMQIIRLAGMLHDIGHYPLSHNIETAYKYGNKDKQYFSNETVSDYLEELVGCPKFLHPDYHKKNSGNKFKQNKASTFLDGFSGSVLYHHEAIGKDIIVNNETIHAIVRKYFVLMKDGEYYHLNPDFVPKNSQKTSFTSDEVDEITKHLLETIAAMVIGNYDYSTCEYKYEEKYTAMLQLIHSDLDADNIDYLLRDATFSGTSYGTMDVSVLMNCLTVKELLIPSLNNNSTIIDNKRKFFLVGVLPKGVACVEQFFQNKYLAYSQMIFGKYVSILEAMILNWAIVYLPTDRIYGTENHADEGKGLKKLVTSKTTKEEYIRFTDSFIAEEFYKCYKDQQKNDKNMLMNPCKLVMTILSRLTNYVAFQILNEERCVGWSEKEIYDCLKQRKLYKEFLVEYNKAKDKTIREFYEWDNAKNLFAFRFEKYSMTKQIPIKTFLSEYFSHGESKELMSRKHFFRLANGVPILEENIESYKIDFEHNDEVILDKMPNLIVDDASSAMSKIYQQQFVFLRKYKIEDYSSEV